MVRFPSGLSDVTGATSYADNTDKKTHSKAVLFEIKIIGLLSEPVT